MKQSYLLLCALLPLSAAAQGEESTMHDTIETVVVTAQQREQRLLDVPITLSSLSARELESTVTRNLEQLSALVPGLNVRIQTPHRPTFVIRGLSSDEVSPTAQPRVSVYFNNIPTSRASMALTELYDMERVEVAKGPLGTLFGRGAQIGAINFISQKPTADFGGYASVGVGNFNMKEVQAALNIPILKDKLTARVAGIYSYQDGYVKNLSGGDNLNGKNTFGGRLSLAYQPISDLRLDLMLSYQKDNNPGTSFMSKRYPNSNGVSDIYSYEASLDSGKTWYNKRDVLLSSLDVRYTLNETGYLTSTTSFTTNTADHHWDGDGTIAPAIDMAEGVEATQLSEELRYHFSAVGKKLTGFAGASYWREDVKQKYWVGGNEQYMAYALFQMWDYMISANGALSPAMPAIPDNPQLGELAKVPLPTGHEEENNSGAINQSYDIFADVTYEVLPKFSITAGLRGTYEKFKTTNETHSLTDAIPSTLGMLTGSYPNFFFRPTASTEEVEKEFLSLTYRAGLKYDISASASAFAGYSRGRRPNVVQFNSAGEHEVLNSENVHSFDVGVKWSAAQRVWVDAGFFYQLYDNFQVTEWVQGGQQIYDAGKATAYGLELTAKAAIVKYLDVFGSYAYFHSQFADKYTNDSPQSYAGNSFRLSPENSFALGFNAKANISKNLLLVFTPTYSWKSHVWFEDSNAQQPEDPTLARLEQDAYGLLNANLALHIAQPSLTVAIFAANLTNEKYIIGAGNTGMMFGVPTYVPGMPRLVGGKVTWKF
ncbi:MAG: TonB-dependent receptor [Prevotellaceae bacterium]|jgi:outer membrane receptor protein involved in Fe transport|nr:TonB-dependent receptor [Prevotellaceae bacterium]